MVDYKEEQEMEMEALEAMFCDEYSVIDDKSFSITLVPVQGGGEAENHVCVQFVCTYTETYPDVAPNFELKIVKGLKEKQLPDLETVVNSCVEENIGMPMIYTIADSIVEWLLNNNRPATDGSIHSEMMERERQKAEALKQEEDAQKLKEEKERLAVHNSASGRLKRFGTPVTKQNFQEWNTVFIAEYDKIEEKETLARLEELSLKTKLGKGKVDRKLTGKRLFEMDTKMITSDAAFLAEMMTEEGDQVFGSSVLSENKPGSGTSVDASLFGGDDLEDA